MQYDLNLLRAFAMLLHERSVTRAAHRLGMTQPALSNALARLRELFRDPLFVRERHGMRPTPKALEIAGIITAVLTDLDNLVLGQQDFDPTTTRRHFIIALNSYVEMAFLGPLVADLYRCAPQMTLRVIPFGADVAETGVMSGDTSVILGRVVDPSENLVVQDIGEDGLACVVRADHPDIGDSISREQYERLKHVNVLPPGRLRIGLFQALERQGLRREVAVSVAHFSAIAEVLAVTDHCATLPHQVCRRIAADPRFKIVPTPVRLGTFPIHMAWHMRYRQDPGHQWLRERIGQVIKAILQEPLPWTKTGS